LARLKKKRKLVSDQKEKQVVVNNRVKRRESGSDNKMKYMMIAMSRKGNILSEISRIKKIDIASI